MDLITKRIPVNDIELPEKVYEVIEKHGIKREDAHLIRKGIVPEKDSEFKETKKGIKTSVDYITTKTKDRDGEIVLPKGAVLDDYQKNPVVLFGHDYKSVPIGKSLWIKADDKGLISKTQYANHKLADDIFNYRKDGFPMAKSIGFVPLEVVEEKDFGDLDLKSMDLEEKDIEGAKRIFPKWLMLEYSDVPVPSNPDALQLAISKGLFTMDEAVEMGEDAFVIEIEDKTLWDGKEYLDKTVVRDKDGNDVPMDLMEEIEEEEREEVVKRKIRKGVINKPETTDNFHHIPIQSAGDFVDTSFRTIDISKDEGIKAVIGKLKSDPSGSTKIQKYLFSVDKFSMEEAKTWVSEHKAHEYNEPGLRPARRPGKKEEEEADKDAEKKDFELFIIDEGDAINDEGMIIEDEETLNKQIEYIEKSTDGKFTRWNMSLPKSFDVESVELQPSTAIYDIVGKYLECKTKDIYQNPVFIPSAMIGNYLSALKEIVAEFVLEDIRNFTHHGTESPPIYEIIQLNSKTKDDFLIDGMSFYKIDKDPSLITKVEPVWGGMQLTLFTTRERKDFNSEIECDLYKWVKENNFLKGEKFALSGEFLEKTEDDWSNLFLKSENELAVRRTVDLINKKGKSLANRGILLMGPPGTGKTLSGRVIMNNVDEATFIWISAKDFYRGGAIGGLDFGFSLARDLAPSILFVEDVDNWLGDRTVDFLKTEMDGLKQTKGVVTILTSNYPEMLPDALIDRPGRFHDVLNFDLPDSDVRERMVRNWAQEISNKMLRPVINAAKGMSGAHIFELISFAKTLVEEDGLDLDEALRRSFEKLTEQRELISQIRGDKKTNEKTINEVRKEEGLEPLEIDKEAFLRDSNDSTLDDIVEFESEKSKEAIDKELTLEKCPHCKREEKAGRIFSAKNRKRITSAMGHMQAGIEDLTKLMDETNPDKEDNPMNDISEGKGLEVELVGKEKKDSLIEFDVEELGLVVGSALAQAFSKETIDVDKEISDGIEVAKGRVL